MGKAGRSVLWFLGACMAFTQAVIGTVARAYTGIDGSWVLLFGFMCLTIVLTALVIMFVRNPAFITAERGDLVPLSLIQQVARGNNPELLKELLKSISSAAWTTGETDKVDDDLTEYEDPVLAGDEVDESDIPDESDNADWRKALESITTSSSQGED